MNVLVQIFYRRKVLLAAFICLNIFSIDVFAQQKNYTISNAHAHNDYLHPSPFYTAFNAGFGSIEADVFPVNGVLYVAHDTEYIQSSRTLKSLYLEPLLRELAKDSSRRLKLLIDVKKNYSLSLQILLKEIEPLKKYLVTSNETNNPVIILMTGERPPPSEYKNYPNYIFFDDDLKLKHTPEEWKRVGQVSLSFEKFSKWKGEKPLKRKDKKLIQLTIDSVHRAGKTMRFWAMPDTKLSWETQMILGVDLIGTDKIEELANFLKRE